MKSKAFVVTVTGISLIGIFLVGMQIFKRSEAERMGFLAEKNAELFVRDYSPRLGNPEAPVYLVEFLDPECESCREFYPYVKEIMSDYDSQVQLVIRYAPFHKNSKHAVQALEATRKQGKYWESLEILFAHQPAWASHHDPKPELIWTYLPDVGVDVERAKQDMSDPQIQKQIDQDVEDAQKLGVTRTPTFFVNGQPLMNFGPEPLRELIDQELSKIKSSE